MSIDPPAKPVTTDENTQITIDGQQYNLSELSAEAQAQIRNIQEVDRKMVAAQNEIKSLQTWRMVHSHSLKVELESAS